MKQVFINLAVADVNRSMDFYTQLGFENNPQFSDNDGKCMVWSEHIFVMLLSHDKFRTFTNKPLADTRDHISGLFALSVESVSRVNEIVEKGLKAGGIEPMPMLDHGFMQVRKIEDYDGHTWEIFYMDMSKLPAS
ncbi:VOC family protein [Sphingobacterium thalpophilum]|uniref:Predicted lactoylglutathione lyase n=1 Tax=Sphingobacterium thalpophilum TaxID=259 RepID=A0A4U9UBN6_9SPHI|nr:MULTISPECIES: VOC family protein [Sphingobacterium]MCW8313654.1 VOC family protein [Sphingobacterium sp. InxBP1]VTR28852.1 Predicted lactoylglutathione lyase [Sphingobacterium thalpophilum]